MCSYLKTCIQSWASFPSQMMAEMQSIASCWDRQWVTGPEQCLTKSSPIHSKNFNASEPYFSINLKKSVNLLYSSSSILALTVITATNRRITIDAIAKKEYKKNYVLSWQISKAYISCWVWFYCQFVCLLLFGCVSQIDDRFFIFLFFLVQVLNVSSDPPYIS